MTGQSTTGSIPPPASAAVQPAGSEADPPPAQRALFRGTRPLKRWRWVGLFDEQLMACAALVQIGPARQSFWALYERPGEAVRERTRLLPRSRELSLLPARAGAPGTLRISDLGVELDVQLEEEAGVQALCPHGAGEVWTRKQAGIRAHGSLSIDGGPSREIDVLATIDDTAGHHARRTEWWWSTGVGVSTDGRAVAWNLVQGVNDPPSGSERAVWVAHEPREVPPVRFAADLLRIVCEDGSELLFTPEAERARRDRLLLVSSDYRAPFGAFSGRLPGGIELAHGLGVMEHHRARW